MCPHWAESPSEEADSTPAISVCPNECYARAHTRVCVAGRLSLIEEVWEVLWWEVIFLSSLKEWAGVIWTKRRDFSKWQEVWQRCKWERAMFKELKLIQDRRVREREGRNGKGWLYRQWQRQGYRELYSHLKEPGFYSMSKRCCSFCTASKIWPGGKWGLKYDSLFAFPREGMVTFCSNCSLRLRQACCGPSGKPPKLLSSRMMSDLHFLSSLQPSCSFS